MGDVDLQSIAYPVEGLSLAGDQDTDLFNDIQSSQVVCKKYYIYTIQNPSWYIIIIFMLALLLNITQWP